mmetsp:Transcript_12351/g.19594  ORF Transcript_12351/g.19594 Transcript_12351/m.19594 type:complete len:316 (-) Transcript_12351:140-1087(-)
MSATTIAKELKPVVVTGANKGIGLGIVQRLLDETKDIYVFLGSRSLERGEAGLKKIVKNDTKSRVSVLQLDVSDENSIKKAAEAVKTKLGSTPLYALVNNAGVAPSDIFACGNKESFESTMKVNYYGLLNTTNAFIPMMGKGGRVVNISSASGPIYVSKCSEEVAKTLTSPKVTLKDIENFYTSCKKLYPCKAEAFTDAGLGSGGPYGISKASVNALTIALARESKGLIVNACTPGFIATDLVKPMVEQKGKTAKELGAKTPYEGALCALTLVTEKAEKLGNGWFYGSDAKRSPLHKYRGPGTPEYDPKAEGREN